MQISKTLLITTDPPGDGGVGQIILRDLCRYLPKEQLVIFSVTEQESVPSGFETEFFIAPDCRLFRPVPGKVGALSSLLYSQLVFRRSLRRLERRLAEAIRAHCIERIWISLNSMPLITLGPALFLRMKLPVYSLVWDPPAWLARRAGWDGASIQWAVSRFEQALKTSVRTMVVSREMVDQYRSDCKADCVIVRHAIDHRPAVRDLDTEGDILIGFAGTLYDKELLNRLLKALQILNWRISGRPVRIRMIGNWYKFDGMTFPCRIELLGWRGTEETHRLLSDCHVNFLPIPFAADWEEFARLSFPTKLSTYLATGRPVLVHAPEYSSTTHFCNANGIGRSCASRNPEEIAETLCKLFESRDSYRALSRAVVSTCQSYFSVSVMKSQFAAFLGMPEDAGSSGRGRG